MALIENLKKMKIIQSCKKRLSKKSDRIIKYLNHQFKKIDRIKLLHHYSIGKHCSNVGFLHISLNDIMAFLTNINICKVEYVTSGTR